MSDPARQDRGPDLRLLKFAAPILLSTLACLQIVLGLFFGLTPWKGGGFGMFSTVDSNGARSIRVMHRCGTASYATPTPVRTGPTGLTILASPAARRRVPTNTER